MSTANAAVADATEVPAGKKSKKKLLILVIVAVLLLAGAGVGALLLMKKKAADHEGADDEHAAAPKIELRDAKNAPAFVPLDVFTVNLADRQADRYAQIGITLELSDPKLADTIKAYMPAVRNNVLLLLSGKTAPELSEPGGKQKLAEQVQAETLRALGVDPAALAAQPKGQAMTPPVRAVYFSTFIIQ